MSVWIWVLGFFFSLVGICYLSQVNYINVCVATCVPASSVNLGCAGGNLRELFSVSRRPELLSDCSSVLVLVPDSL